MNNYSSCCVKTFSNKFKRRRILLSLFLTYTILLIVSISCSNNNNVEAFTTTTTTAALTATTTFHRHPIRHIHHHGYENLYHSKKIRTIQYASKNSKSASSSSSSNNHNDQKFQKRSKSWVVIVDDEESIRLSIGNYLYQAGYSVTACSDAEALLEILSSVSQGFDNGDSSSSARSNDRNNDDGTFYDDRFPNAIICDIRIPGKGMDGLELLMTGESGHESNYMIRMIWEYCLILTIL